MRAWWAAAALMLLSGSMVAVYWANTRTVVFLVSLDTVRADRTGCYGYDLARTPFLDSLAAGGTMFRNAITCSSFTSASHASILTGLYPPRHGVRFLYGFAEIRLNQRVKTLPEALKERGFVTAAFVSGQSLQSRIYGLNRGFDHWDEEFLAHEKTPEGSDPAVIRRQRRADRTLSACLDWLSAQKPYRSFIFIHLFDAHDSQLVPPKEFVAECQGNSRGEDWLRRYDCEIAWMDSQLKDFFSRARSILGRPKTLVVVLADHGQGLGDHGYGRHGGALYQEQLRVPLIMNGAGVPAGLSVDTFVRTVDVPPTVLDAMGTPPIEGVDGRSLLPVMRKEEHADRPCYAETLHPLAKNEDALFAIIKDRRKLIFAPQSERTEYYNLTADPREHHNLASRGGYDDLMAELRKFDLSTARPRQERPDVELEEAMRALGYVD
ncbi:MAG: sulfatase [Acidobacteriota bacterium]